MSTRTVVFDYRQPDLTGTDAAAGGYVKVQPFPQVERSKPGYRLIPEQLMGRLVEGVAEIPLECADTYTTGCWVVESPLGVTRFITVPAGAGDITADACLDVDPATFAVLDPAPSVGETLVSLQAQIDNLDLSGTGLPAGGTAGQVPSKNSSTDGDASWRTLASADISDLPEAVQDIVGAMLVSGGTLTLNYNDATGTVTITGTGTDAEAVRDAIGAALIGTGGVTVAINDALDTITIGLSGVPQSAIANLTSNLAARVRTDTAAQGLDATQQANARANIDVMPTRVFTSTPDSATLATLPVPCLVVVRS